jgi:hypothetical protein
MPQRRHVARPGEGVDPDVVIEIEGRIVFPVRQGEIERRVAHALCEARHRIDGALEGDAQPRRVGGAVEDHQHRHGCRLGGRIEPPEGQIFTGQTRVWIHDVSLPTPPPGRIAVAAPGRAYRSLQFSPAVPRKQRARRSAGANAFDPDARFPEIRSAPTPSPSGALRAPPGRDARLHCCTGEMDDPAAIE